MVSLIKSTKKIKVRVTVEAISIIIAFEAILIEEMV